MSAILCRAWVAALVLSLSFYGTSWAARAFLDGAGPMPGDPTAPALFDSVVIGDFNSETPQGWTASPDFSGGGRDFFFTNEGGSNEDPDYGLGNDSPSATSDGLSNPFIRLNLADADLPDVPEQFQLGILPGQFDVISFSLRFDALPTDITNMEPGSQLIVGEQFFEGNSSPNAQAVYYNNPDEPTPSSLDSQVIKFGTSPSEIGDGAVHGIVIHYLPGDAGYGNIFDAVRIDPIGDHPISAGSYFMIDNITLSRSLDIEAFEEQIGTGAAVGDVNKNGDVDAVDLALMQQFLGASPGAVARQNDLIGIGFRPHQALETLNLTDFDLSGDARFDATDMEVLQSVIDANGGTTVTDWDRNGVHSGSDFLAWQRLDGSPGTLAIWSANYGSPLQAARAANMVPEPSALLLSSLSLLAWVTATRTQGSA